MACSKHGIKWWSCLEPVTMLLVSWKKSARCSLTRIGSGFWPGPWRLQCLGGEDSGRGVGAVQRRGQVDGGGWGEVRVRRGRRVGRRVRLVRRHRGEDCRHGWRRRHEGRVIGDGWEARGMSSVMITFRKFSDTDCCVVGEPERGHQVVGGVLVQGGQGGKHGHAGHGCRRWRSWGRGRRHCVTVRGRKRCSGWRWRL